MVNRCDSNVYGVAGYGDDLYGINILYYLRGIFSVECIRTNHQTILPILYGGMCDDMSLNQGNEGRWWHNAYWAFSFNINMALC